MYLRNIICSAAIQNFIYFCTIIPVYHQRKWRTWVIIQNWVEFWNDFVTFLFLVVISICSCLAVMLFDLWFSLIKKNNQDFDVSIHRSKHSCHYTEFYTFCSLAFFDITNHNKLVQLLQNKSPHMSFRWPHFLTTGLLVLHQTFLIYTKWAVTAELVHIIEPSQIKMSVEMHKLNFSGSTARYCLKEKQNNRLLVITSASIRQVSNGIGVCLPPRCFSWCTDFH